MVRRDGPVLWIREVHSTNNSSIRLTKRQAWELAKYNMRGHKSSQNPKSRKPVARVIFIDTDNSQRDLSLARFLPERGQDFPAKPSWWRAENLGPDGYYGDTPAPRPVTMSDTPLTPVAAPSVDADALLKALTS